jgi:hypothetical protein
MKDLPRLVLKYSTTSRIDKLVLLCIAIRTKEDGLCPISWKKLAKDCDLNFFQVDRRLKRLQRSGELEFSKNKEGTACWKIVLKKLMEEQLAEMEAA